MKFKYSVIPFILMATAALAAKAKPDEVDHVTESSNNTQKWWPWPKTTTTTTAVPPTTTTTQKPLPTTTPSTTTQEPTTSTQKPTTTPPTTPSTPPTTPTTPPTTPTTPPTTPTTPPTTPTTPPTTPTPPPTSTFAPVTTTVQPLTPKDWIVNGTNGTICIIANMHIKITVPYKAANKTATSLFELTNPENATASGQCGDNVQELVLNWTDVTATFKFSHFKGNKTYWLDTVSVNITVNNNSFPNNTNLNVSNIVLSHNAEVFSVPVNHSYTCASVKPVTLNGTVVNGTIAFSELHVEAFGIGTAKTYSAPKDCSPYETPDIVPIVVGLVLAGLVVVVLIAYLVGRRRAQARGYLSM